jgi:hypothetical protein
MKWPYAIALTVALVIVIYASAYMTSFDLGWVIVPGTALWAAVDSTKIGLKRYKSGLSYGPVVLFIGIALLWVVVFPWYLIVRDRVKRGVQPLNQPPIRNKSV